MIDDLSTKKREEIGYRKGVLLGLTVAEIILLLLFALLLALWGQISSLQQTTEEARVIKERFSQILKNSSLSTQDIANIKKSVAAEIDYANKLAEEIDKVKDRLLPQDVYEAIKREKFDLSNPTDRQRFFNLMKIATTALEGQDINDPKVFEKCEVGAQFQAKSKGSSVDDIFRGAQHWKDVAASCGKASSFPSCYVDESGRDVLIYEARLNDGGIFLKKTIPDVLVQRFDSEISQQPRVGVVLSPEDFLAETKALVAYGTKKECRFRVNAFDDTGTDKKNFQRIEKILERVFFKRKNW